MRRREILAFAVGAAALLRPCGGYAQQAGRTYRLGVITPWPRSSHQMVELLSELARQGFVERENLEIDPKSFNTPVNRFFAVTVEMAQDGVDAIAGSAVPGVQRATHKIPMVLVADNFLSEKLVPSLAHPGGNITGVSIFGSELDLKRQELLLELVPGARHIATLVDPDKTTAAELAALREAARRRGVALTIVHAGRPDDIAGAIEAAKRAGAEALNVLASLLFWAHHKRVVEGAARNRLPAIHQWPEEAAEGGFAAYGPTHDSIVRQWGRLIAAVLRGAEPANTPVERPDRFEFVVNLKIAKALGLTVPPLVIARADEVIE